MDYPGRSYGHGTRRGNYNTRSANNYNYDRPANNRFDHDSYNHFSHGNTQGSWNTGRPSFISGVNPHSFNDAIRHNSNVSRDQHTGSDQRHRNNSGSYMHENYDQGAGNFAPNTPRQRHSNNSGSYMHENYDQGAGYFAPNTPRRHRRGGLPPHPFDYELQDTVRSDFSVANDNWAPRSNAPKHPPGPVQGQADKIAFLEAKVKELESMLLKSQKVKHRVGQGSTSADHTGDQDPDCDSEEETECSGNYFILSSQA